MTASGIVSALARYARSFHQVAGDGHHVASPLGAWLLLAVASHTGEGILSRVTSIQRIHTEGGLAPSANTCDASANGKESRSAYAADYYFYAPGH